jgi:hypothetical protein
LHDEVDVGAQQRLAKVLVNTPVVPSRSIGALDPSPAWPS